MGRVPENQPVPELHHFTHEHVLQLLNHQPQQSISHVSCSGCTLPLSGPVYGCPPCNYFLHLSCSKMPQQITHPFDHHGHVLVLNPIPIYPEGAFNCDACAILGTGFSYHCAECGIDLHVNCAATPLSFTHQSHPHQLDLIFSPPYSAKSFSCDLCKNLGSNHWLYRCNWCEFDVHLDCATSKIRAPIQTPLNQLQSVVSRSVLQAQSGMPAGARVNRQQSIGATVMNRAIKGVVGTASQALGLDLVTGLIGGAIGLSGIGGGRGGGGGGGVTQALGQNLVQGLLGGVGSFSRGGRGGATQVIGQNLVQGIISGGGDGGGGGSIGGGVDLYGAPIGYDGGFAVVYDNGLNLDGSMNK